MYLVDEISNQINQIYMYFSRQQQDAGAINTTGV
jgi:hypothetical protein